MPNLQSRIAILAAAALCCTTAALAQQPGQLDQLSACRLDADRIVLRFTFEGGACQQPLAATLEPAGSIGNVIVPTEETAPVCTMQIVPVEFAGTLPAPEAITSLDIMVQRANGEPQALGSTDILAAGAECTEPDAAPAQ